jgi:hypothetical protein
MGQRSFDEKWRQGVFHNLRYVALGAVAAAAATVAIAQSVPSTPGPETTEHRGMKMNDHDGMSRMMDNCNRMMESFLRKAPQTPSAPAEPENKPKG